MRPNLLVRAFFRVNDGEIGKDMKRVPIRPNAIPELFLTMIRFLRQYAEILTGVCVLAAVLMGGSLLYVKIQADKAGQAQLDALVVPAPAKTAAPAAALQPEAAAPAPAAAPVSTPSVEPVQP
jgi:hypothetical protein